MGMMTACQRSNPSSDLTESDDVSSSKSQIGETTAENGSSESTSSSTSITIPSDSDITPPSSKTPTLGVVKPTPTDTTGGKTNVGMDVYHVKNYGAVGNGQGDDGKAIQKAIDAASSAGGGTVYLPQGVYSIKTTIVKKAKVSIVGDNMQTTTLKWTGSSNGVIINTANQALHGTSIERLTFTKASGSEITGILGGSTKKNYNSAIGTFKDLTFMTIEYGIRGNAEAHDNKYNEAKSVGIFDCYFENIVVNGCKKGFWLFGSGNTIVHPRAVFCDAALALDFLNWESYDGIHVIGGIFASNKVDVLIEGNQYSCLRPTNFVGTWFENSTQGIVKITNPNTRIQTLTFRDCMLNTADSVKSVLDFRNAAKGNIIVDGCSILAKYPSILAPTSSAKLIERDNYIYQ